METLAVDRLICPSDKPHYCGIISKPDDGIAVAGWGAVVGVDGEEQGAQHSALWRTSPEAEGCGRVVAHSDLLG